MPPITLKSTTGKWIMASAILASAMAFIDGTALNVVLPSLQKMETQQDASKPSFLKTRTMG